MKSRLGNRKVSYAATGAVAGDKFLTRAKIHDLDIAHFSTEMSRKFGCACFAHCLVDPRFIFVVNLDI
jgi:hypothetical protein